MGFEKGLCLVLDAKDGKKISFMTKLYQLDLDFGLTLDRLGYMYVMPIIYLELQMKLNNSPKKLIYIILIVFFISLIGCF